MNCFIWLSGQLAAVIEGDETVNTMDFRQHADWNWWLHLSLFVFFLQTKQQTEGEQWKGESEFSAEVSNVKLLFINFRIWRINLCMLLMAVFREKLMKRFIIMQHKIGTGLNRAHCSGHIVYLLLFINTWAI